MKYSTATAVVPPCLVVSVIVWVALALAGVSPLVAAAPAAAAGVLAGALVWFAAPRSALRALGARPLARGLHPRLENLVEGLCTTHGFRESAIHVVETASVNAAALGLHRPPSHLVVTSGALNELDRLELEAVVARQLCEIKRGVAAATVLAGVARIPGAAMYASRVARKAERPDRVAEIDIEAVRLTSYPPALVSALRKSAGAPCAGASGAVAHLWLVAPSQTTPRPQFTTAHRIGVLDEI